MKLVTLILSIAVLFVGCTKPKEAAPEAPVVVLTTPEVVVSPTPPVNLTTGSSTSVVP